MLLDLDDLPVAEILDAHACDGGAADDFFVFLEKTIELERGIEAAGALRGGEE
jgi:hypothetical protein